MTPKAYLKKVKQNLFLPADLVRREANALLASWHLEIQGGRSWEEIFPTLKSPEAAAAEIQAKYPKYHKNPWRLLFLLQGILGLLGIVFLGINRFLPHYAFLFGAMALVSPQSTDASLGIIGGADGPTAVFITAEPVFPWSIKLLLLLFFTILGFFLYRRYRVTAYR